MKIVTLIFLISIRLYADESCQNHKDQMGELWVEKGERSQAQGWIWFLGTGEGDTEQKAYLAAEGMAIDNLIKECIYPHKEVKFYERCVEKRDDGKYLAYTRASVRQKDCNTSKYANETIKLKTLNKELVRLHDRYRKILYQREINLQKKRNISTPTQTPIPLNYDGCEEYNFEKCSVWAKFEWNNGNRTVAVRLAEKGCNIGDLNSCFYAGYYNDEMKNFKKAFAYYVTSCGYGDEGACFNAGIIGTESNQELYFRKSCAKGFLRGCVRLAQIEEKKGNLIVAEKYYLKGCLSDEHIGCSYLGILAEKLDNGIEAYKYYQLGCKSGSSYSCLKMGIHEEQIGNKIQALNYYQIACDVGNDSDAHTGCRYFGHLQYGKGNFTDSK